MFGLAMLAVFPFAWHQPALSLGRGVARASSLHMMAQWQQADLTAPSMKLPAEVDELLSEDTDRIGVRKLWCALRKCYATEEEAVAAVKRNTGTILPYLNAPSNIYGSYEVLVDLLGDEADAVVRKNPGVLQCNPKALARESADSIRSAADTVDFFETGILGSMPPALRQNLDKVALLLLAVPIYFRLQECTGGTCGYGAP